MLNTNKTGTSSMTEATDADFIRYKKAIRLNEIVHKIKCINYEEYLIDVCWLTVYCSREC